MVFDNFCNNYLIIFTKLSIVLIFIDKSKCMDFGQDRQAVILKYALIKVMIKI